MGFSPESYTFMTMGRLKIFRDERIGFSWSLFFLFYWCGCLEPSTLGVIVCKALSLRLIAFNKTYYTSHQLYRQTLLGKVLENTQGCDKF